jgi:hypothetical protein
MVASEQQGEAAREIASLADLDRDRLLERWRSAFPGPVPKSLSQPLMVRALAWHIQAGAFGGLSASASRTLRAVSRSSCGAAPVPAGSRLVREWNGRTHVVDITEHGYRWTGRAFRSLSAIAREITGAHWSGPRFFGLTARAGRS